MQDKNSFSISDPIRTKESGHCIVMWQFNIPGGVIPYKSDGAARRTF